MAIRYVHVLVASYEKLPIIRKEGIGLGIFAGWSSLSGKVSSYRFEGDLSDWL